MHKSVYNWPIYQYLVVFIDILIVGAKGFGLLPNSMSKEMYEINETRQHKKPHETDEISSNAEIEYLPHDMQGGFQTT